MDLEEVQLALRAELEDPSALHSDRGELVQLRGDQVPVDAVRVVATGDLCLELHLHALLDVVLRQVHALHHADARAGDGLVLLVAHGAEPVDASDAHPVQHVGHHGLEPRVADAGDHLGVVEVHLRPVAALLVDAGVVDAELDDLAEAAPLLPEVDDDADASALRALHRLLQREDEVGPAAADVAAEDVRADALVVHADDDLRLGVPQLPGVTEGVDRAAAHGGDVGLDTRVEQLVVVRELVEGPAELLLAEVEPLGQSGDVPGVVDGALRGDDAFRCDDGAVHLEVLELGDV
mmetsp:Transcript_17788/g.46942  ORF Transcript_17788/g.46942 Transcript_17788/m.46942 type:complete len:293 (+) Transcript_17788:1224-2102(+)